MASSTSVETIAASPARRAGQRSRSNRAVPARTCSSWDVELPGHTESVAHPPEAGAEPIGVQGHEQRAFVGEPVEDPLLLVLAVALDPERHGRREVPRVRDRAIGAAELRPGEM